MLDMILNYVDANKLNISSADIADLNRLSQTFRSSFLDIENDVTSLNTLTDGLEEEQKTIHYDLTDHQAQFVKLQEQNKYLWVGVGVAAVLGILF